MNNEKEVYFAEWCPKCVNAKADTVPAYPCWECLDTPVNIDSHKPINFKEARVESKRSAVKVESYTVSES